MQRKHLSNSAVGKRAKALYEQSLRTQVETAENIGKMLLLDVETGHYEIDADGLTANSRLRTRYPETNPQALFAIRIGYDAAYSVGGTLTRVIPE